MEIKVHHSDNHMISAVLAAEHVAQIEKKYKNGSDDPGAYPEIPPNVEHTAMVSSCVISSFAFVEAFVNETYDMINRIEDVERVFAVNEELTGSNFTRFSTLRKYQALLIAMGHDPFEKGRQPYQDLNWLRKLRNYWVHFEPDVITDDSAPEEKESNLEGALRDRVEPNPLYENGNETYLPRMASSYSCCEWSMSSAIAFVEEFQRKIDDNRSLIFLEKAESILPDDSKIR
ncbi:hypothetical protein [Halohasta litorea]|uniref:Apea-like HEPN domain-containing protein n=1 Tax=Halohasta litorea TaxID=869891 RepID=A0ABD6DA75_9EURY|nr:hypothetical protein [Halohasta litorea]